MKGGWGGEGLRYEDYADHVSEQLTLQTVRFMYVYALCDLHSPVRHLVSEMSWSQCVT